MVVSETPNFITSPNLGLPNIRHGFFTRNGGVSTGLYQSLNCGPGSGDVPANVTENRQIVAKAMGVAPGSLLSLAQVHSAEVVTITEPFAERPRADGMVTAMHGLGLGILSADCGPLLFVDPVAGVIGAAHAGWKGALGGILENTVAAMEKLGAARQNIKAALGPCIGPLSYEVDAGFRQKFIDKTDSYNLFFTASTNPGRFQFDLPAFLTSRAKAAGLADFAILGIDTYRDETRFFSYRRTTHRHEPDYGRQLSVITLMSAI
jgi:YfiH family protein